MIVNGLLPQPFFCAIAMTMTQPFVKHQNWEMYKSTNLQTFHVWCCLSQARSAWLKWNASPIFFGFLKVFFYPFLGGPSAPWLCDFHPWPHANAFGIWNSSHHSSLQRWSKSLFLYISAHEFPLLLSGSLTKLWGSRFQDPKPRRFLVVFFTY